MEENRNNEAFGVRTYTPRRPAGTIVDTGYVVAPAAPVAPVSAPVPGGVPVKENVKTNNLVKPSVPPVAPAATGVTTQKTEKTDVQVSKPKTPDAGTVPVKKEDAATETKDTDEKMSKAEKAALRFIQNKKSLQQKKDALERGMKELEAKKRQLRQEKKEAEAKLKKFDKQEEIVLGLAAIPTAAEDRPNRIKAIDSYFNLLNLFNKSDASGEKKFSELYNAVHPVTLLFGYVAEAAKYDVERHQVVIDEALLFRRVRDRLAEQERLKAEAEATLQAMANK